MFGFLGRALDPRDPSIELHDLAAVVLVVGFVGLAVTSAWSSGGHDFNPATYGAGAAALVGAIAGAGWLKGRAPASDPSQKEESPHA